MDPESVVTPLLREVAAALDHWLVGAAVPYTFVGGFAVALLGRPRATGDVYAVAAVNDDRLEELAALGAAFGFIAREHDLVPFARQFRVLRLVHTQTNVPVDVALAGTRVEMEAIERSQRRNVLGKRCRFRRRSTSQS